MWEIKDGTNNTTTIDNLIAEYPDMIALDESAWEVSLDDFASDPEGLADAGFGSRDARRILFWANKEDSIDDPGEKTVAMARWIDAE